MPQINEIQFEWKLSQERIKIFLILCQLLGKIGKDLLLGKLYFY